VGHDITSCTADVDFAEPFQLDGRRVFLMDTPGFDDTNKTQLEILRIIANTLETQFKEGVKLHGVIYVHRISDNRVGGVAKSTFRIFRKICGDDSLKNVIIATTMWSKVSEAEGQRRVQQLESLDDFFKPAIEKKAQMVHHKTDTVQSARDIIRRILDNHPQALALQTELVVDGKPIEETAASRDVEMIVTTLKEKYEKELRELRAALNQAIKQRDDETKEELKEDIEKARAEINKLKADQESHAAKYQLMQLQESQRLQEYQRLQDQQRLQERNAILEAEKVDRQREKEKTLVSYSFLGIEWSIRKRR